MPPLRMVASSCPLERARGRVKVKGVTGRRGVAQTTAAAHPQGGATSLGRTSGSTLDANTAAIDFQTLKGNAH